MPPRKSMDELTPDEHRAFMDEQRREHPMHHHLYVRDRFMLHWHTQATND